MLQRAGATLSGVGHCSCQWNLETREGFARVQARTARAVVCIWLQRLKRMLRAFMNGAIDKRSRP